MCSAMSRPRRGRLGAAFPAISAASPAGPQAPAGPALAPAIRAIPAPAGRRRAGLRRGQDSARDRGAGRPSVTQKEKRSPCARRPPAPRRRRRLCSPRHGARPPPPSPPVAERVEDEAHAAALALDNKGSPGLRRPPPPDLHTFCWSATTSGNAGVAANSTRDATLLPPAPYDPPRRHRRGRRRLGHRRCGRGRRRGAMLWRLDRDGWRMARNSFAPTLSCSVPHPERRRPPTVFGITGA